MPDRPDRAALERARTAVARVALRTPVVRLDTSGYRAAPAEVWLKLECLQPIGSFKLRGAASAVAAADPELAARGLVTASAGNMAQGVAWMARELGVPATVIAPDHAPRAKLDAVERLGGRVVTVPFERWWQTLVDGGYPGAEGVFVHPVEDAAVVAGNGTIGLELAEQLPAFDTVLVPWGGGGLTCGIASALALERPDVRVVACEPETAAPLVASLRAGEPTAVDYRPSFVDGAGGKALLPAMWELARGLVAGAVAVPLADAADAVRVLALRGRVVAEGAGALAVAAALAGAVEGERVVCIVSGGAIDAHRLAACLDGRVPD